MNELMTNFLRTRQIDSFQKLRILLFMAQHPHRMGTCQQWAEWLYLGDTPFLEKILGELRQVGLINCKQEGCTLVNEAEIKISLQALGRMFNDPLARQTLLHHVSRPKSKRC
jgi:DNA-binding IscR family transcriptional regulator